MIPKFQWNFSVNKMTEVEGMVVEEERGAKGWCSWLWDVDVCVCMFCWPFVSRQVVQLWSCWIKFLCRVVEKYREKQRNILFLHEKSVPLGPLWEQTSNCNPFLILVSNLTNSSVTRNSVPKVVQRELCSQSGLSCFFQLASDTQMSNAVKTCMRGPSQYCQGICARAKNSAPAESNNSTQTHYHIYLAQ